MDFWHQLIDHRILRNKIKEQPAKKLLGMYREKNTRLVNHKMNKFKQ